MSKRVDLLHGGIAGPMVRLAMPIVATSLIQMAYNMTDMIWIGRVDANAVASVGAAGMFMWLSTGLVILARMGGQVKVAHSLGAGRMDEAARYARTCLQMGIFLALLFTVLLLTLTHPLIGFFKLNSPKVVADAEYYLWIVGAGMIFSFMNQILTALITITGNSKIPFIATTIGLGVNLVLDPVLIFGVGPFPRMEVVGAAIATVLAQAIVFFLFLLYVRKDEHLFCHVHLWQKPDFAAAKDIFHISLPAALQNVLFPLISMFIARLIAGWGDVPVAVQKVGSQIESISWMMTDGFSMAINSFVAQNYGAGNFQRAKKGYYTALAIAIGWGTLCSLLLIFCAAPIFQFFIPDPQVLPLGVDYLVILGFSQLFMCTEGVTSGAYAGFGRTLPPSLVSITLTAARIPCAMVLSSTALGLNGIWWSISLSSVGKGTLLVVLFLLFLKKQEHKFMLSSKD